MTSPNISVIIPMYNSERYIKEAIYSIFDQTYQNFEIIIIDDCSTDSSVEIVKNINDNRITLIRNREKNLGSAYCRNLGIDLSKGNYIALMDSDDVSNKKRLQTQFAFLEENKKYGLCSCWYKNFGNSKRVHKYPSNSEEIKLFFLFETLFCQGSAFLRKSVFKDGEIKYNTHFRRSQDYEFWNRLKAYTEFYNIPKVLYYRRVHKRQTTHTRNSYYSDKVRKKNMKQIIKDLSIETSRIDPNSNKQLFGFKELEKWDFTQLENWIELLINQNKKTNYYENDVFAKVLLNRFWRICKSYGMFGAQIFFKSRLKKYGFVPLETKFKSFLYSLLPIKKSKF